MSAAEEIQVTEAKLLQGYVDIAMDMLNAILKDKLKGHEYPVELNQRVTKQLQEQYPNYIFYVGKGITQACMPMGIPITPVEFAKLLEQCDTTNVRCKQCDGVLE